MKLNQVLMIGIWALGISAIIVLTVSFISNYPQTVYKYDDQQVFYLQSGSVVNYTKLDAEYRLTVRYSISQFNYSKTEIYFVDKPLKDGTPITRKIRIEGNTQTAVLAYPDDTGKETYLEIRSQPKP